MGITAYIQANNVTDHKVFSSLTTAVHHFHSRQVTHRDISDENVLVMEDLSVSSTHFRHTHLSRVFRPKSSITEHAWKEYRTFLPLERPHGHGRTRIGNSLSHF